ncbi:hypothetical protein BLOT_013335 [Blomia tropicalis]|nr:hypothetical protein BLOT_013335 [Blomia tropicalis]
MITNRIVFGLLISGNFIHSNSDNSEKHYSIVGWKINSIGEQRLTYVLHILNGDGNHVCSICFYTISH